MWPTNARERAEQRYPLLLSLNETALAHTGDIGRCVDIPPDVGRIVFGDLTLVNSKDGIVRARRINVAVVVRKDDDVDAYRRYLSREVSRGDAWIDAGVTVVLRGEEEAVVTAGNLSNLYLMDGLHETELGKFLQEHDDIILSALQYQAAMHQPILEWVEGNPDPQERSVQPDLLLRRLDGTWDICDLKLGLVDKRSITVGRRRRRDVRSEVSAGISQLANYREYFQYPANRKFALEAYGVEVVNPTLILIVGTQENVDATQVAEAMRPYDSSVEILDWDTLLELYLALNGVRRQVS
jgi:hypothetical protein